MKYVFNETKTWNKVQCLGGMGRDWNETVEKVLCCPCHEFTDLESRNLETRLVNTHSLSLSRV